MKITSLIVLLAVTAGAQQPEKGSGSGTIYATLLSEPFKLAQPHAKQKSTKPAPAKIPDQTLCGDCGFANKGNINFEQSTSSPVLMMGEFKLKTSHMGFTKDGDDIHNATLSFDQPGSGRIDRISDNEYAELQKLRKAVADKEIEIAKAHAVELAPHLTHKGSNTCLTSLMGGNMDAYEPSAHIPVCDVDQYSTPDRYEYRGQFLLINLEAK